MPDANDMDLVREFARTNSETAFTELVRRHINLVYSVARRCTGTDGDAQDVTQAVFIILARKAAGLGEKTLLTGWLYETTRFTAARLLRTNARRHAREQEAYMQSTLNEADTAAVWEKLSPHLEAAMSKLAECDRALLVLRFYENKTGPEAAALLGIREDAAHKRLTRAIEKLRKVFAQRGVTISATVIAGTVSANSVQAAPAILAKTTTAVGLAKGAAASISTLTLVKGTLKLMTWTKLKFALGMSAIVLLAGGVITTAISQTSSGSSASAPTPQDILKQEHDAYAALSTYSDDSVTVERGDLGSATTTSKVCLSRPNLYKFEWTMTAVGSGGNPQQSKGAAWSAGDGDFLFQDRLKNAPLRKVQDLNTSLSRVTGLPSDVAKDFFGTSGSFDVNSPMVNNTKRLKDENIGGEDCYVVMLSSPDVGLGTSSTTVWVGKKDFLIRKMVEAIDLTSMKMPTDAKIAAMLKQEGQSATPDAIATRKMVIQKEQAKAPGMIGGKKMTTTKTHENISVNQSFSKDDFVYVAPAGATP